MPSLDTTTEVEEAVCMEILALFRHPLIPPLPQGCLQRADLLAWRSELCVVDREQEV